MLTVAQARADAAGTLLRSALAKRRLVGQGGAYALILDMEPALARGPLAGVPLAVKDLIDIAGTPTRCSSAARRDAPTAERDAPVVATLRAAGALIVGKTALHEFAFGATGINRFAGTPRNPRDPDRIPGGSSSGSAVAVAEGSAAIALGTDTGGSVRIPAALCGVVGYKPTYGLLSADGVFPLAPSLDHVGVLAPDVASAREAIAILAPEIRRGAATPRRIGVDRAAIEEADRAVAQVVSEALRAIQDVPLHEVDLPDRDLVVEVSTAIMFSEAAAVHRELLRERSADYGEDVRARLAQGAAIPLATYELALAEGRALRRAVEDVLDEVDAVLGPTVSLLAPRHDAAAADAAMGSRLARNTRLANVTGLPAVSVPLLTAGLPVGLQVLARTDALALAGAALLERALRAG